MDVNIMILNVLDYTKEGKEHSTLNFIFADKQYFQDTEKFLGYGSVTQFYNKHIRNLIPSKAIGQPLKAHIGSRQGYRNPLKTTQVIESIEFDGKLINLL